VIYTQCMHHASYLVLVVKLTEAMRGLGPGTAMFFFLTFKVQNRNQLDKSVSKMKAKRKIDSQELNGRELTEEKHSARVEKDILVNSFLLYNKYILHHFNYIYMKNHKKIISL
jgi:hypothetical protein